MKIHDLIQLLQNWQDRHGPNAQIAVPRSDYERDIAQKGGIDDPQFGETVFLHYEPIATYLDSKGPEVEW